jgi:hypothetical protein
MKGRLTVESKRDYEAWLAKMYQEQQAVTETAAVGESAQ